MNVGITFLIVGVCVVMCVDCAVVDPSVRVDDDCIPGDDSTCPDGHCCVKEGLAYIPEATGPKPAYRIACLPYRGMDEFCYSLNTTEMCPCSTGLTCQPSREGSMFGHCA